MTRDSIRDAVARALADGAGIIRLEATWVARDWLPPGRRLGLSEASLNVGERGFICERWLGSCTKADNRVGPADEGLSYLALEDGDRITLKDAVASDPVAFMGAEYAATHVGLGRLAKIFDFSARVPFHLHPRQQHASLVGRHQKDEAYYYPEGVDMGVHPESFLGLHPFIRDGHQFDVLLPYLEAWDSDRILEQSRAYLQTPQEGFHTPSGVLHAPGTALTFELQEDSDVLMMFQALNAGRLVSKDLLFKDIRPEDRQRHGDRFLLQVVDWDANCDPYYYENHHLSPQLVESTRQPGGEEHWIYYNTRKFSGKRLIVRPGQTYSSIDKGVYNILVWRGKGTFGGLSVASDDVALDELLITHDRAIKPITVVNTGTEDLQIFKFFGPDINLDVPMITPYPAISRE